MNGFGVRIWANIRRGENGCRFDVVELRYGRSLKIEVSDMEEERRGKGKPEFSANLHSNDKTRPALEYLSGG